ncbi:growth hormone secretagogue receptor type 1 [Biomphalaria glabrata]|nr:growth hormone secretagogue receptor type 1-like [Biomphalaria glabrata]
MSYVQRSERSGFYNKTNIPVIKDLSDHERVIIEVVTYVFLCGGVSIFGIVSNVVNMAIFFKQGLRTTMNISFFSLAISDVCSLVTLFWFSLCMNPLFENSDVPFISREIQYLTGGWPSFCFARITSFITSYITAERCLCIISPLKVKHIITPKRTLVTIVFIYIFIFLSTVPEYASSYISWKHHPIRNQSVLGLVFYPNRKDIEGLGFVLNAILGTFSYILIILFTTILVCKLRQENKCPTKNCIKPDKPELVTNRKKAVNMVLIIAVISIVCSTPCIIFSLVSFFEPEFSILGGYCNIFHVVWSFGFLFTGINSSVNAILYYQMSSKYKKSFHDMFFGNYRINSLVLKDNNSGLSNSLKHFQSRGFQTFLPDVNKQNET